MPKIVKFGIQEFRDLGIKKMKVSWITDLIP
jgi:hypothetical protein